MSNFFQHFNHMCWSVSSSHLFCHYLSIFIYVYHTWNFYVCQCLLWRYSALCPRCVCVVPTSSDLLDQSVSETSEICVLLGIQGKHGLTAAPLVPSIRFVWTGDCNAMAAVTASSGTISDLIFLEVTVSGTDPLPSFIHHLWTFWM